MRPYSLNKIKSQQGTSIVELGIVSALMLMVSLAMVMVLTGAINYYHATNATLDAQQGVLFGMNRISQELVESHRDTVLIEPNLGIIFASPRDPKGNYQFDSFGRLQWQKLICYYLGQVGPEGQEVPALLRREVFLSALGSDPTSVPPKPALFGQNVAAVAAGPPGRMVGRYVVGFEANESKDVSQQQGASGAFGSRVIQIKLRATTTYRNSFSVEAETSVLMRN